MSQAHPFASVQRLVLKGSPWRCAQHLMLRFVDDSVLNFLNALLKECPITAAQAPDAEQPKRQFSLGFTRRGLEAAHVPDHVLAKLALKAPAFWAGAVPRASTHVGLPERWQPHDTPDLFGHQWLDAVFSVHANDLQDLAQAVQHVRDLAQGKHQVIALAAAQALPAPTNSDKPPNSRQQEEQWVHFGYRDGLSRTGIRGWHSGIKAGTRADAWHAPGEFLLGQPRDSGASAWVSGPGLRVWPLAERRFFLNGSFGVFQQIEQNVEAFEQFVSDTAKAINAKSMPIDEVKAWLCGRSPLGQPLGHSQAQTTDDDFDYADDLDGKRCPFGAHMRRMNPRLARRVVSKDKPQPLAHFGRARPLLRRGMPYGPPWTGNDAQAGAKRGLYGHFFCTSIEDQYEHLVREWGERLPMGSPDRAGARDPLMGNHQSGDRPFEVHRPGQAPLLLKFPHAFARTLGLAYLFYPSLDTLQGMAENAIWWPAHADEAL